VDPASRRYASIGFGVNQVHNVVLYNNLLRLIQLRLSKGPRVLRGLMVCWIILQAHVALPRKG
jgi:hypothetical protein